MPRRTDDQETTAPRLSEEVVAEFRAGIDLYRTVKLVPARPDDQGAFTIEQWRAQQLHAHQNWLDNVRTVARNAYKSEGIPSGADEWVHDKRGSTWRPLTEEDSRLVAQSATFERDLWFKYGKPEGGTAWAAGMVLGYAQSVTSMLRRIRNLEDESARELSEWLAYMAFELSQHLSILRAKTEPQDEAGRSAEHLIEAAIRSANAPRKRVPTWVVDFKPNALEYCERRSKVSYGDLIAEARRLAQMGKIRQLPRSDDAIKEGIKRLEREGLVLPGRNRG